MMVHKNLVKSTLLAAVGALLTSSPIFAASIANGNFETNQFVPPATIESFSAPGTDQNGFIYLNTGNTTVSGWSVINGTQSGGATYLGNQIFNNNGSLSRLVQLNGQSAQGGLSTTVTGLTTGQNLSVYFDLSGNPNASPGAPDTTPVVPVVSVALVDGGLAQTFTLGSFPTFTAGVDGASKNLSFTNFVANFLYTGETSTAILSFTSQSGRNLGPIIDNVSLTPPTAVPFEFSPVSGFIIGGVLFGASKLVKRSKFIA